jgi:cobyrinic acid a,c-diamide synthase
MLAVPRIVIAGTQSGCGKTTIATALMAAFARRGLRVQPFKIGPDFIDPGFHEAASGRASRNLDGWMLSRNVNLEIFARAAQGADMAVIEGVMGLFDGRSPCAPEGSTAEMAKWLEAPILLVVDASAMARSAAAVVQGFENFDPEINFAGVLFNHVGSPRHAGILRQALEAYCRAVPLGFLPPNRQIALPTRHLGLTIAGEVLTGDRLAEMAEWVGKHVDLDSLLRLARDRSPALPLPNELPSGPASDRKRSDRKPAVRIGIARDAAFCFYYRDNLDLLSECGAELVEFSPIADLRLPPEIGGLYLGGGYPELHAAALSANRPMLESIRHFAQAGAPIYAECGGFMYLTEAIVDAGGHEHPMCGIFPTRARMQSRLAALGYVEAEPNRLFPNTLASNTLWLNGAPAGQIPRGHEFRYSQIEPMPGGVGRAYRPPAEGYSVHSVLGSYVHLHFLSCPDFAQRFVRHCGQWRLRNPL